MQVGVVEMHDCFSANELVTYEALGLCAEGKAGEFIDKGDNTYGGRVVCNVFIGESIIYLALRRIDIQRTSPWCNGVSLVY